MRLLRPNFHYCMCIKTLLLQKKQRASSCVSCATCDCVAVHDRSLLRERRRFVLLVFVKVKRVLDLISETLTVRRFGVSSMLLFVDITSTTALFHRKLRSFKRVVQDVRLCGIRPEHHASRAQGQCPLIDGDRRQPVVRDEAICLCCQHLRDQWRIHRQGIRPGDLRA